MIIFLTISFILDLISLGLIRSKITPHVTYIEIMWSLFVYSFKFSSLFSIFNSVFLNKLQSLYDPQCRSDHELLLKGCAKDTVVKINVWLISREDVINDMEDFIDILLSSVLNISKKSNVCCPNLNQIHLNFCLYLKPEKV